MGRGLQEHRLTRESREIPRLEQCLRARTGSTNGWRWRVPREICVLHRVFWLKKHRLARSGRAGFAQPDWGLGFTLKSMFDRSRKQKNVKKSMFWTRTRGWQLGLTACLIALTACGGSTNPMGPRTPSGFKVTPGNAQVVLTWTANREADMAAYIVSYGPASGALNNTSLVNAPATTTTITGLTNGTPYLFAIAARNTAGATSGRTPGILGTPVAPPPPPPPTPPAPPTP